MLQNFAISGLPQNTYYLYISSDSIRANEGQKKFPNERIQGNKYYYYLPIKLDPCPTGGILEEKAKGFLNFYHKYT